MLAVAFRDLTVTERVRFHLSDYSRVAEEFEIPVEVMQNGIVMRCLDLRREV